MCLGEKKLGEGFLVGRGPSPTLTPALPSSVSLEVKDFGNC